MLLLTVDFVLLALAAAGTFLLLRRDAQAWRRAEAAAKAKLAAANIQAEGTALGIFVARSPENPDVVVTNRTPQTRPGAAEQTDTGCLVRVALPLPNQIACRAADADVVMGPLPSSPRFITGHAAFDNAYAVFIGPSTRVAGAESYRAAPVNGDVPWVQTRVLERLLELDLLWLRVRDGQADLAFPTLAIEDVKHALAVGTAFERAAYGKPGPPLAAGRRTTAESWPQIMPALVGVWGAGVFPGLFLGSLLCFLEPLRNMDPEFFCGGPHRIVVTSSSMGDGISYGFVCEGHLERSLDLFWLGGALLGMSLVVNTGIVLVARWSADARRKHGTRP